MWEDISTWLLHRQKHPTIDLKTINFRTISAAEMAAEGKTHPLWDIRKNKRQYTIPKWMKMGLQNEDFVNWMFTPNKLPEVWDKRIPSDLRAYSELRKKRAIVLETKTKLLPQEEWTNLHEDAPHMYPYIAEWIEEESEREAWRS